MILKLLNRIYKRFVWAAFKKRISIHDEDKRLVSIRATLKRKKEEADGTPNLL